MTVALQSSLRLTALRQAVACTLRPRRSALSGLALADERDVLLLTSVLLMHNRMHGWRSSWTRASAGAAGRAAAGMYGRELRGSCSRLLAAGACGSRWGRHRGDSQPGPTSGALVWGACRPWRQHPALLPSIPLFLPFPQLQRPVPHRQWCAGRDGRYHPEGAQWSSRALRWRHHVLRGRCGPSLRRRVVLTRTTAATTSAGCDESNPAGATGTWWGAWGERGAPAPAHVVWTSGR